MKPLGWFVAFSVVLIRMPTILGITESPLPWILVLSPFWLYTLWRLVIKPWKTGRELRWRVKPARAVLLVVFLGLLFVAFVRAGLGGAYSMAEAGGHTLLWGTISAFGASIFWMSDERADSESLSGQAVQGLALSLPIYVTLNVVLHLLGVESPKTIYAYPRVSPAQMFAALGIPAARTLFPMAAGIAGFGMVAGGAVVSSACLLFKSSHSGLGKGLYSVTLVASVYAVLATDTRAAALFMVVTLFAVLALPKLTVRLSVVLTYLSPLFPVILVTGITGLSALVPLAELGRTPQDLRTLNSRTIVWSSGIRDLPSHGVKVAIGHGYEGHYISGVSQEYAHRFSGYVEPEVRGLHNVYLQFLYDMGLIGVSVFLALAILLMKTLSKWARSAPGGMAWPLLGLSIYMIFAGSMDRIPTPYSQELFLVFLMILIYATMLSVLSVDPGKGRSQPTLSRGTEDSHSSAEG